ncbi:MAG TPA: hypothetical protein VN847_06610 [Streptosporangiaceae bacterium]|nr:hypothetical protein [Streptosporangiaceae bacterium]
MSRLDAERRPNWAGRAVMALTVLALVLVAIVPLALLAGVVMMVLGHVTGGFALFGGSVLAAIAAVILAARTGLRHLRREISRSGFRIGPLDGGRDAEVTPPADGGYPNVVQLDHRDYTEVR